MQDDRIASLSALAEILLSRNMKIVTAESCTGGGIASAITDLPGSSGWFECGFVTYSNEAKIRYLDVAPTTIEQSGAVSEQTVRAMVSGAVNNSLGDIAVAVSGVAGPGGGSVDKPVGTVWFAWGNAEHQITECCHFDGDRHAVREQAIDQGIRGLCRWLSC
ncbi:MAG: damage-inducible protein CinA [Oceanospirillaceae bacterium]|nr:damage-inducible protein CinA [Oceanospirillaceae bacterium]MBT13573.1 damage-inducible protein CinA [Oceanospirillaceae bacterium]|tara:strand:- start:40313 stop:40798 length:486 start_codon:yes stop_codon:yes gene_type:complete